MNDRYLFRGMRIDNGEWVQGNLVNSVYKNNDTCVGTYGSNVGMHQVDPSTICQCTGLKDKNGKLIWENDIVFVTDDDECSGQINTRVGEIEFFDGLYDNARISHIEVIGNKFDDPWLLEVQE